MVLSKDPTKSAKPLCGYHWSLPGICEGQSQKEETFVNMLLDFQVSMK